MLVLGLLPLSLTLLILSDSSPFTESAASWVSIFWHFATTTRVLVKFVLGLLQAIFVDVSGNALIQNASLICLSVSGAKSQSLAAFFKRVTNC